MTVLKEAERASFANFCDVLGKQLIPYINRCLEAIFPSSAFCILRGSSLVGGSTMLRFEIKSLQTSLEPVMSKDTAREEKPGLEKEAKSLHAVSPINRKAPPESELVWLGHQIPEEKDSQEQIEEDTLKSETKEPDLT